MWYAPPTSGNADDLAGRLGFLKANLLEQTVELAEGGDVLRLPEGSSLGVGDQVLAAARWDDDAGLNGQWVFWLLVKLGA